MGDRDFRTTIQNAIKSIGNELEVNIDSKNFETIHLQEVVRCMRRSYYDRLEPLEIERRGFNELLSGLLRKLEYGSNPKDFEINEIKLRGQADMIVDDAILLFRSATEEIENPHASDVLYLNACMWIYDKEDGMVVYITGDRKESTFSLTRNKETDGRHTSELQSHSDLVCRLLLEKKKTHKTTNKKKKNKTNTLNK